jgi:hypothetical protein
MLVLFALYRAVKPENEYYECEVKMFGLYTVYNYPVG